MGREPLICRCNLNRQTFIIDARPGPARQAAHTIYAMLESIYVGGPKLFNPPAADGMPPSPIPIHPA